MIKPKLLFSFLIGISFIFVGEIKAEENICEYSNYKEFKKCKKKKLISVPKYPIENFHWIYIAMGPSLSSVIHDSYGSIYDVIEFKAYKKDKLEVTKGTKSVSFPGLSWRKPFINKEIIELDPNKITSLKKRDFFGSNFYMGKPLYREYKINFIDDYGELKSIQVQQYFGVMTKTIKYDMLGDYLIYASNLNWGEEKSVYLERKKYLKENEKNIEIIKSIILTKNNTFKNCIEVKETKFPELVQRYEFISRTINPLRMKLGLPPSNDLKLICK